jgi:hypothetical protein
LTIAASADVLVYRGSSVESRPGFRSQSTPVFWVYDTFSGRASLLARSGGFYVGSDETTLTNLTIADGKGGSFLVLYGSSASDPAQAQVHWQFVSNSFQEPTIAPRLLSGTFSAITPEWSAYPQRIPATFSSKRLTLALDRQQTDAAARAHDSFDRVVDSLWRILWRIK